MLQNQPETTWQQVRRVLSLALPMAWSRLIQMFGWFVSMLMIAHLGTQYLAASALFSTAMVTIMLIFITLLFAVSVVTGRLYGEGRAPEVGVLFQQSLLFALVSGVLMMFLFYNASHILLWLGQAPKLVSISTHFFHAVAWTAIPLTVLTCFQQCCYGLLKQRLVIISSLISTAILIPLSYLFIFGKWGMPALGVAGLGYALLIQNIIGVLILFVSMRVLRDFEQYQLFNYHAHKGLKYIKQLYQVGWPMCLQFGGELLGFFVLTIFTGWISQVALAASQLTQQVMFLLLVPLFAVAESAGILVSQAIGAKKYERVVRDGNFCVIIGVILVVAFSSFFFIIPDQLAAMYINIQAPKNYAIVTLSRYLFYLSAFILLMDTVRNLYSGALRGFYDTQYPMWLSLSLLWLVGLPMSYFFGFVLAWGVIGIRVAVMICFTLGACLLYWRWHKKAAEVQQV